MIDTHCHLTHAKLRNEQDRIVDRARAAGLRACITIGTGAEDARRVLALKRRFPGFVYGTAGIDPFTAHRLGQSFEGELQRLEALLRGGEFCALGEIGLDYHYELDSKPTQAGRLERQLSLAATLDLPVVIHVREAHVDMARVLASHPENRGVIHSFTAGPAEAERYLELGWLLAFNGVITFPDADEVREAARRTPAERVLLETDSPYLAPVPRRGRRCEPSYIGHTLERLAEERGQSAAELARTTTDNARRLFRLAGPAE